MSHDKLRDDTECQNCGHTVGEIYCPHCGQKNTETRQSFHHLAAHVVEDITHYDTGFWRTIKTLLSRPAKLTIEYLSGKRQSYVPPVKLYIFISFITFFLLSIIPDSENDERHEKDHGLNETSVTAVDTVQHQKPIDIGNGRTVTSVQELETLMNGPEAQRPGFVHYYFVKKLLIIGSKKMDGKDIVDGLLHTMPKVLFIYMPLFAFWLWLLHGKQRWYFFDHGIFTLHYFSFLLLCVLIIRILDLFFEYSFSASVYDVLSSIIGIFITAYSFFYFFRAHSKMYGERKLISRLKSSLLFIINMICISCLGLAMLAYIILNSQHH
jgi:hypothetical protein